MKNPFKDMTNSKEMVLFSSSEDFAQIYMQLLIAFTSTVKCVDDGALPVEQISQAFVVGLTNILAIAYHSGFQRGKNVANLEELFTNA